MSGKGHSLAGSIQTRINRALNSKPCGRCKKDHMLKNCPMTPNEGRKGSVWKDFFGVVNESADTYLRAHPEYEPIKSAPPHSRTAASVFTKTKSPPRKYEISKESVEAYVNNTPTVDMYYPREVQPPSQIPTGNGKAWKLSESMASCENVSKIPDPLFPPRESFFDDHSKQEVILTNHFEYKLNTDTFYEYRILDLGTKNRKRMRDLIGSAMTHWSFLQQNMDFIATNYIDTVVSWKPLHLDLPENSCEWFHDIPSSNRDPIRARFKFANSFDADKLREYASAQPSYARENFEDIARCLNIVISKSFGNGIHKLSSNKFFVKSARAKLFDRGTTSNQLELIRGYFYSVKPGMDNIILNFNICTSAVFRPIALDDFLYRNNTFTCDPPEKLESILRGKTVYLKLDRKDKDLEKQKVLNSEKSRYWKIWEIQPALTGNIEDLNFPRPVTPARTSNGVTVTETIRVVDHLRDGKSCQHYSVHQLTVAVSLSGRPPISGRPAVNVGSRNHPIWYALEHLQLVPYQPYTRPVPDGYTRSMVEQACRDPQASRALIENEGLSNMGFAKGSNAAGFVSCNVCHLFNVMLM